MNDESEGEKSGGDRRFVYLLGVIAVLVVALIAVLLATLGGSAPTGEGNTTMTVPSVAVTENTSLDDTAPAVASGVPTDNAASPGPTAFSTTPAPEGGTVTTSTTGPSTVETTRATGAVKETTWTTVTTTPPTSAGATATTTTARSTTVPAGATETATSMTTTARTETVTVTTTRTEVPAPSMGVFATFSRPTPGATIGIIATMYILTPTRTPHYVPATAPSPVTPRPTVTSCSLDFSGSPRSGRTPLAVTFTLTATCENSYTIQFGDGQQELVSISPSAPTTVRHTYYEPGTYTVTVTEGSSMYSTWGKTRSDYIRVEERM